MNTLMVHYYLLIWCFAHFFRVCVRAQIVPWLVLLVHLTLKWHSFSKLIISNSFFPTIYWFKKKCLKAKQNDEEKNPQSIACDPQMLVRIDSMLLKSHRQKKRVETMATTEKLKTNSIKYADAGRTNACTHKQTSKSRQSVDIIEWYGRWLDRFSCSNIDFYWFFGSFLDLFHYIRCT